LLSGFPAETLYAFLPIRSTCPSQLILLDLIVVIIMITIIIIILIIQALKQYVSNITGEHEIKALQTTAILGTAHILRIVLM